MFNGKSFKPEWRFVGDSTFWTLDPKETSIVGYSATTKTPYALLFSTKADEYQEVILTVKKPNVYVNVNGIQALGETDPAGLAAGAKAAWNYTNSTYAKNPGSCALQVHKDYAIDIRFKNIMIL